VQRTRTLASNAKRRTADLRVSGVFERLPDDRRSLISHDGRASVIEMEGIFVEVGMLSHKGVQIVDENFLRFD
jgi:hypothetical protein